MELATPAGIREMAAQPADCFVDSAEQTEETANSAARERKAARWVAAAVRADWALLRMEFESQPAVAALGSAGRSAEENPERTAAPAAGAADCMPAPIDQNPTVRRQ